MNKKIAYFILLTYLISWSSILILNFTENKIIKMMIVALWFMPGPLYATLILEKFNKHSLLSFFNIKKINYKYLLYAPFIAIVFNSLYLFSIFILGNLLGFKEVGTFSLNKEDIINKILTISPDIEINQINLPESPMILLVLIIIFGSISGAIINFPFALGEELGWRGYFLKELTKKSLLSKSFIIGIFWGLWHFPLIMYGLNFDKNPIWGTIIMIMFCIIASLIFNSLTVRANSVIAPTLLHGSINATAPGIFFLIMGGNNLFNSPVGIMGIIAILFTYVFFFYKKANNYEKPFNLL